MKDKIRDEIKSGGTESPCPFCGIPRLRRSDYIRCGRCAINWIGTEALDRDPRQQRMDRFLAETRAMTIKKDKEA